MYFRNKFDEEFLLLANNISPKGGEVRLDQENPLFFEIIRPPFDESERYVTVIPLLLYNHIYTTFSESTQDNETLVKDKIVEDCWSFSFSIIPSKEIPGLISFRMDWLDLLVVQGTLKSLLQHHSSKASILQHSAFFTVQLSYPYMTTGKTIALTRRTFVGKVMSLRLKVLSRLVTTFLPKNVF